MYAFLVNNRALVANFSEQFAKIDFSGQQVNCICSYPCRLFEDSKEIVFEIFEILFEFKHQPKTICDYRKTREIPKCKQTYTMSFLIFTKKYDVSIHVYKKYIVTKPFFTMISRII